MSQQTPQPNDFHELYLYYSRIYDYVVVQLSEAQASGSRVEIARHEAHRDMVDDVLTRFERLLFPTQPRTPPMLRVIPGGKVDNHHEEKGNE
jgi:hypothetical protein